ncbi:hypothetical protein ACQP1U_12625 [Actinomycetota bacterium]|nr:hypothetical protein [Micrococcales bacterium]
MTRPPRDQGIAGRALSRRQFGAVALGAAATVGLPGTDAAPLHTLAQTRAKFAGQAPGYWGLEAPEVIRRFPTATAAGRDAVCLTLDACGGGGSLEFDSLVIGVLRMLETPATLFINRHWAQRNRTVFASLLADPLFDIQQHGDRHGSVRVS